MKLTRLVQLVKGKVVTAIPIDGYDISGAMGANLMSDVLTSTNPNRFFSPVYATHRWYALH